MGFYFDLCLLLSVLTLWSTSHAYATRLKRYAKDQLWANLAGSRSISSMSVLDKPCEKWMELYQSYKGIRTLSQLINNAYGNMTTAFIAESILYHSMNMDAIFLTNDGFNQARLIFFILSSSSTFIFSADICTQMDSLKGWLSNDENRRNVPLDELNVVLHELQTTVIGIRGSNIFTITYSLVWNSRGLNNGNGGGGGSGIRQ
ncbi:unnamed protein product [Orchesella dallaii]|uniref:Uncharacterized protein n=1 Tax=Orchesella dallaii TaxID=48710 RepID=A0ABP1QSD1_9HEXA